MSLVTMSILDSNLNVQSVIFDDVSGDFYPVYKLSFGEIGSAGSVVSETDPLPVQLSDGIDSLDVIGDGDTLDLEGPGVDVGVTKGLAVFGVDTEMKARAVRLDQSRRIQLDHIDELIRIRETMQRVEFQLGLLTGHQSEE